MLRSDLTSFEKHPVSESATPLLLEQTNREGFRCCTCRLWIAALLPVSMVGVLASLWTGSTTDLTGGRWPQVAKFVTMSSQGPAENVAENTQQPLGPAYVHLDGLGWIQGKAYSSCRLFLGIRYGWASRWKVAEPIEAWRPRTYLATNYGPVCPATSYSEDVQKEMHMVSHSVLAWRADVDWNAREDCLFLNVYTPGISGVRTIETSNLPLLPVLVWLHGGSFISGAGSDITSEDAAVLTTRGVVVVTVNYRLGGLGYMASKFHVDGNGNFGLLDQRSALEFVHSNIASFGGDPERVTLFGWSAGAASISAHLTMPRSQGLFRAAIMQSGGFAPWFSELAVAEKQADQIASCLSCNSFNKDQWWDCMQGAPLQRVLSCSRGVVNGPVYGTDELAFDPVAALETGHVNFSIPVIIGSALADSLIDIGIDATRADLRSFISSCFPDNATAQKEAFHLYDPGQSSSPRLGWSANYWATRGFQADWSLTCRARRASARWAAAGKSAALWYQWGYDAPFNGKVLQSMANKSRQAGGKGTPGSCWPCPGAGHGSELPFLFRDEKASQLLGNASKDKRLRLVGLGSMPPVDALLGIELAEQVQDIWIRFATDPISVHSLWRPVQIEHEGETPGAGPALVIEGAGILSPLVDAYKAETCNFWDTAPAIQCR